MFNPFTADSFKSKINKVSKLTNRVKLKNKQCHSKVLLHSFLMNGHTYLRVLSMESKVRKLCITQGFTLGVIGLKESNVI